MPLLQYYITSNNQTLDFPQKLDCKHLHLKNISVRLSALPAADSKAIEIEISGIKHYYQINSSTNRANIIVPLSTTSKLTQYFPDIIMAGEEIQKTQVVKVLEPDDGTLWTDSGGATIECIIVDFDYVLKDN